MDAEEINLLDYWRVLVKGKMTVALIVIVCTLFAAIYSLLLPNTFKAQATILVMGGPSGGGISAVAASMGLGGLFGDIGGKASSSNQLVAILKSRTLAERIIERHELMKLFYPDTWSGPEQKAEDRDKKGRTPTIDKTVDDLFHRVSFSEDNKNKLLIVSAIGTDPSLSARLVNWYIEELGNFIKENTFTNSKRNRIFVAEQLEHNKAALMEAGKEITTFYATNRVSNVISTMDVNVSLDIFPALADANEKAEDLKRQVDEVKSEIQKTMVVKEVPQQVYLQYLNLRREFLGQVNSLLMQQYEMAKIEEVKEDINFQVIDWARVPVRKYKPKRAQIVMMSFVAALFLAVFYVFFREYLEKMKGRL